MGAKKGRPSDQMKRPDKQRSGKTPHRCSSIQFCLLSDTSHHSTDFSLAIKVGKGIEQATTNAETLENTGFFRLSLLYRKGTLLPPMRWHLV